MGEPPAHGLNAARASVARGEILFNTKPITISGVNGLNLFASDPLGATTIVGTCGTCHDSPNVGNHSKKLPLNIGIADATPPVLDVVRLADLHRAMHRYDRAPRRPGILT